MNTQAIKDALRVIVDEMNTNPPVNPSVREALDKLIWDWFVPGK